MAGHRHDGAQRRREYIQDLERHGILQDGRIQQLQARVRQLEQQLQQMQRQQHELAMQGQLQEDQHRNRRRIAQRVIDQMQEEKNQQRVQLQQQSQEREQAQQREADLLRRVQQLVWYNQYTIHSAHLGKAKVKPGFCRASLGVGSVTGTQNYLQDHPSSHSNHETAKFLPT